MSQTNPQTRPQPTPPRRRLELVGTPARGKSPQYLSRRGSTFYFARKIPADAREAFPGHSSLVTESLGTHLLEKAKVLLAVEVTEFDLTLANHRRQQAAESAEQADASVPRLDRLALLGQAPALGPQEQERLDLVRTLEANLERLRSMTVGSSTAPAAHSRQTSPAVLPPRTVAAGQPLGKSRPRGAASEAAPRGPRHGKIKPTMLHLFEDWKRKQDRPSTINAVAAAVLEFRELHGPMPVESLNRQHGLGLDPDDDGAAGRHRPDQARTRFGVYKSSDGGAVRWGTNRARRPHEDSHPFRASMTPWRVPRRAAFKPWF